MKRSAVIALLLVYAAMCASAYVADVIFERLPHLEDEIAYLYQARIFEKGDLYIATPEPRLAYWQPFVIDCTSRIDQTYDTDCNGRRFGKYPPGWSLLLAFGTANETPWVVNVFFAGLVVAMVYRFGRELYNETAGVAGALLMTISPIAVLLNGTLMGHTSALFLTLVFLYSLWRIEHRRRVLWWGVLAGLSLGFLIIMRPLSAVGIAIPYVLYSVLRLTWLGWVKIQAVYPDHWWQRWGLSSLTLISLSVILMGVYSLFLPWQAALIFAITALVLGMILIGLRYHAEFWRTLRPLIAVGVCTLALGALYPAYNHALTGNSRANMYRFVWDYDQIGFGPGHGRAENGHNLERAQRIAKRDTHCYARDLFGWVQQPDNPPDEFTATNDCLRDKRGYSWVLLVPALLLMSNRRWTLLLLALAGSLILIHFTYWIGAGIYSARYYYEATGALAIASGAGIAGLVRLMDAIRLPALKYVIYTLLGIAVAFTSIGYTPKRLEPLVGYECTDRGYLREIERLRESPDKPVLVIAYGEQSQCKGRASWRDIGSLMAVTDPYTENDIIMLRDLDMQYRDHLIAMYPERQVIYMMKNRLYLPEDAPGS